MMTHADRVNSIADLMRASIRLKMIDGPHRCTVHAQADPHFALSIPRCQPTLRTFVLGS
jgi:hypothetical protein